MFCRCIPCKGSRYPATLPRPAVTVLPFCLSLCEQDSEKSQYEVSGDKENQYEVSGDKENQYEVGGDKENQYAVSGDNRSQCKVSDDDDER